MAQDGAAGGVRSHLDQGRWSEALEALSEVEGPLADALASRVEVQLGEHDAAIERAEAALASGEEHLAPTAILVLGTVAVARGEVETGLLRFDDSLARARAREDGSGAVAALLAGARVLLDRDGPADSSAAVGRLADARKLVEADDRLDAWALELRLQLARARASTGDLSGGVEDAKEVAEAAKAQGRPDIRWRALDTLATLEHQRGSDFVARRHEQAAMEVLESIVVKLPRDRRESFWRDPARRALRLRASASTDRRSSGGTADGASLDPAASRLLEVIKRLAREHDVDRLLERITDAAVALSGAERGFLLLPDEASGDLTPRLVRSAGTDEGDPSVAFSRSIAEAVLIDGEPILTVDAAGDRRLSEYLSVHKLMLRSVACLPVRGRSGTNGVLYLEHRMRKGRFREEALDLLMAFADQVAIALENAQMVSELERRKTELEDANREIADAKAEVERVLALRTDELEQTKRELETTRDELRGRYDRQGIIGRSEPMRRVFAVIDRVRENDVPVVIQGESGTGKELVARAIHYSGNRAKKPFIALNCAAVPEALLESELFGHVRGAFTGADRDRKGVLSRASGGTLFLDEVGDMPMKMQVDLLRVLQDHKVRPIGGDAEELVDVRYVCASNKSLRALVERGEFREDLYYRLNVVEVRLPPLRERRDDIPLLCDHFLARIADKGDRRFRLSREALARLQAHPLPGNVRQLEHILLNASVMGEGPVLQASDLALGDEVAANDLVVPTAPTAPAEPPPQTFEDFKDAEKQKILAALEANDWNRAKTARALGIPRRTFYRRLKEHDILS